MYNTKENPIVTNELIIQNYSSFDKTDDYYPVQPQLDGNLMSTLHSIAADMVTMKQVAVQHGLDKNYHVMNYYITRPLFQKYEDDKTGYEQEIKNHHATLSLINDVFHKLFNPPEFMEVNVIMLPVDYCGASSITQQRINGGIIAKNVMDILGTRIGLVTVPKLEDFDCIETCIETIFDSTGNYNAAFDKISAWRASADWENSEKPKNLYRNKRFFVARIHTSINQYFPQTAMTYAPWHKSVERMCLFADRTIFHNIGQADYIRLYAYGLRPDAIAIQGYTHSMLSYKIIREKYLYHLTQASRPLIDGMLNFIIEHKLDYILPFRVTDPSWGADLLSPKDTYVVYNPVDYTIGENPAQDAFNKLVEGHNPSHVLATIIAHLETLNGWKKPKIKTKIPIMYSPLHVFHHTALEIMVNLPNERIHLGDDFIDYMSQDRHNKHKILNNLFFDLDLIGHNKLSNLLNQAWNH